MTESKQTILVVDDDLISRELLVQTLSQEYLIEQAHNGGEALARLRASSGIAAVVLDLLMPVMDGYQTLDAIRADEQLSQLPVIVVTATGDEETQVRALECGAADLITKPFNPRIILSRIRNLIDRRRFLEVSTQNVIYKDLLDKAELDEKTGIYNKDAFCRRTRLLLLAHPEREYLIVRWDIDRFKVLNDVYTTSAGDIYLAAIGRACRERANERMTCGHWDADHFVLCLERDRFDPDEFLRQLSEFTANLNIEFDFGARVGVYLVDDPSLDVTLMCDRALLALRSIKYEYNTRIAYYDESMRAALLDEQGMIAEMNGALESGQFVVYFQPQYNYADHTLYGAEALVRWLHPERGLVPPNDFIPIFEKNGFITKLDEYVWEQVCLRLRQWVDGGLNPVPVSVNVSRRDIYNPHLCDIITGLVEKYRLSPTLLRLEITESVYVENSELLIATINRLRERGFSVEMDDFGNGYSSLNILKDAPIDTLKLDMRFLKDSTNDTRSGIILSSIVRMSSWIRLPVIAEGVETREQADYLKSIGCTYMQGYYFSRPIPADAFELLLCSSGRSAHDPAVFAEDVPGAVDFLGASTQAALLFNSFVGGAAIIEYDGAHVEDLRLNDLFFEEIGVPREQYFNKERLAARLDEDNRAVLFTTLEHAFQSHQSCTCELSLLPTHDGDNVLWLRIGARFLTESVGRRIYYLSLENISERMALLEQNTHLSLQLSSIINTLPGGILNFTLSDRIRVSYCNDMAARMFGYSHEQYLHLFAEDPLRAVHPDDVDALRGQITAALAGGLHSVTAEYRHICVDGDWQWVCLIGSVLQREDDVTYASGILLNADAQHQNEQKAAFQVRELDRRFQSLRRLFDDLPCGVAQFASVDENGEPGALLNFSDGVWRILGYSSREQYLNGIRGRSKFSDIHPDDRAAVYAAVRRATESGRPVELDFRILQQDGSLRWLHSIYRSGHRDGERDLFLFVFYDVTDMRLQTLEQFGSALLGAYDEIYELDLARNLSVLRVSSYTSPERVGCVFPYDRQIEKLCTNLVHPDDRERVRAFFVQLQDPAFHASYGMPPTIEYRIRVNGGNVRWIYTCMLPVADSIWFICNREITDLRRVRQLREDNLALRATIDELRRDDEIGRLYLESTGAFLCKYDAAADCMHLRRTLPDGTHEQKRIERYAAQLMSCEEVSVEARWPLLSTLRDAAKGPLNRTLHLRSKRFGDEFIPCRAQIISSGGENPHIAALLEPTPENISPPNRDAAMPVLSERALHKLDLSPAFAYVIDADSYAILYANDAMRASCGQLREGEPCYWSYLSNDTPCASCPIRALHEAGDVPIPTAIRREGGPSFLQATPVLWKGTRAYLIAGTDPLSFLGDAQQGREDAYEETLWRYTHTLLCLYDEVFEFNYRSNTFATLHSRFATATPGGANVPLADAIDRWISRLPDEDSRAQLRAFLDADAVREAFLEGHSPSVDYRLETPDGSARYCLSTLLKIDTDRYLCCNKDITEQREAEALREELHALKGRAAEQDRYRIVVEQTGTAVIDVDHPSGRHSFSDAFLKYELSRLDPEMESAFHADCGVFHPDDLPLFEKLRADADSERGFGEATLRMKLVGGGYRWTHFRSTHLRDGDGRHVRTICTLADVDSEVRTRMEFEQLTERMQHIIANIPAGVAIYELRNKKAYLNFISDKACELFGYSRAEYDLKIANSEPVDFTDAFSETPGLRKTGRIVKDNKPVVIPRIHARRKDGTLFWLRVSCSVDKKPDGTRLCYAVMSDISAEVESEQRAVWHAERYRILSESTDVITFDYAPPSDTMSLTLNLPGMGMSEEVHTRYRETFQDYQRIAPSSKQTMLDGLEAAVKKAGDGAFDFQADYYHTGFRWYRAKFVSLPDEAGAIYRIVGRVEDINDAVLEQARLHDAAQTDGLTGLQNHDSAGRTIKAILAARPPERHDAILFMDIDNFKTINDTIGHPEANHILRRIGDILQQHFRKEDVTARFGGDEFIVYMKDAGGIAQVRAKARRIIHDVNSILFDGSNAVHCSIGITEVCDDDREFDDVFKRADAACYASKQKGRNRYTVYDPSMPLSPVAQTTIEH